MVIVDTSVLIDYLGNFSTPQTEWIEQKIGLERLGITSLSMTEVLQGIREEFRFAPTLLALSQFRIFEAGTSATDRTTERTNGIFLSDNSLVELIFHAKQLLCLSFHKPGHRDASPRKDYLRNFVFIHSSLCISSALLPLFIQRANLLF